MKVVMDERTKHRLTGVVVIVSIAVIFVPAMIKKSNQRLNENINVSIQLPPKPIVPDVAMVQQKAVFDAVKVARVDVPAMNVAPASAQLAKQDVARIPSALLKTTPMPSRVAVQTLTPAAVVKPSKTTAAFSLDKAVKASEGKSGTYVVQLASFSQQHNAEALVARLRSKGYKANYTKIASKQGSVFKVVVGQANRRDDAQLLQKKLADNMQLRGFIVKTEVS